MKHFSKLLEPFHIGKVKTRNRIIKTASGTSLWSPGERRVLVKRGRKVTIVEEGDVLGEGLILERKTRLFSWFRKKGVTMMTSVTCNEITPAGMVVTTKEGNRVVLEADTVIPALPMIANTTLAAKIKERVPEIYLIGDCKEPRLIPDAVADGWRVGNMV